MRKRTWAIAVLLAFVVLGAAFWWLDFHASTSDTRNESQLTTMTGGRNVEESVPPVRKLALYVDWVGDAGQATILRQELAEMLPSELGLPQVDVVEALPQSLDRPVLMVEIRADQYTWTPVFSRASLKVDIAYASDGATAWRRDFTMVVPPSPSGPVVRSRGTVSIEDNSRGLISHPAYLRHLRQQIASELAGRLRPAISPMPAGQALIQW